jgi:hypothetical protein
MRRVIPIDVRREAHRRLHSGLRSEQQRHHLGSVLLGSTVRHCFTQLHAERHRYNLYGSRNFAVRRRNDRGHSHICHRCIQVEFSQPDPCWSYHQLRCRRGLPRIRTRH